MKQLVRGLLAIYCALALSSLVYGEPEEIRVRVGKMKKLTDKYLFQGRVSADNVMSMTEKDLKNLAHKASGDAIPMVNLDRIPADPESNKADRLLRFYLPTAERTALEAISVHRPEVISIKDLREIGAKAARGALEKHFDKYVLNGDGSGYWYRQVKDGEIFYLPKPRPVRDKIQQPVDMFDI